MRGVLLSIFLLEGIIAYSQETSNLDSLIGKTIRIIDVDQIFVRNEKWHYMSYRAETEVEDGNWKVVETIIRDEQLFIKISRNNYSYWVNLEESADWEIIDNPD